MPSYLAVGHVTVDRLPDGDRAGGTVLFSAGQALALGYGVRVVTATDWRTTDLAAKALEGIDVSGSVGSAGTRFEYEWTEARRVQKLTSVGKSLGLDDIPETWLSSDIWHLAPVAGEVDSDLARKAPGKVFIGVTPQGWMRSVDQLQLVQPIRWEPDPLFLERVDAIVFSQDDIDYAEQLASEWSRQGPIVVVTAAADGATLFTQGQRQRVQALEVESRNELGAGDVFAATLFIRLREGYEPYTAAQEASAAAAVVVSRREAPYQASSDDIQQILSNSQGNTASR